jgi:hypothetical protein
MRNYYPDWRTWLAASLFPFKIYTVAVVIVLYYWYMCLPPKPTLKTLDYHSAAVMAYSDFGYMATYAVYGYFICAGILIVGGLVQMFTSSRRASVASIVFGVAAVVIGWLLIPYCWRVPMKQL